MSDGVVGQQEIRQARARRGDLRQADRYGAGCNAGDDGTARTTAFDRTGRLPVQDRFDDARSLATFSRCEGARRGRHGRSQAGSQGAAMNRTRLALPIIAVILAAGVGGYWLGHNGLVISELMMPGVYATQNRAPPPAALFYSRPRNGKPLYSLEPKTTPDGRPYR